MTLQQLLSPVRRACDEFGMIAPHDKIAVALSGGKDSLAMLYALAAMRRFYPKPYDLTAITVDLGLPGFDTGGLRDFCQSLDVPYTVLETDIGQVVFSVRKEANPCSLCAKMRKGAFNTETLRQGCTRVAYGHNRDDLVHTFFMSLFYEGRLYTPAPVTFLDRSGLYAIRPLLYVPESDIIGFSKKHRLPVAASPCPADGRTKREEARQLAAELRGRYQHFDAVVFNAIKTLFARQGAAHA